MAPTEKTEVTVNAAASDRNAPHHEGLNSGLSRGFSSPLLGENPDRSAPRATRGHTSFAGAGGWAVTL